MIGIKKAINHVLEPSAFKSMINKSKYKFEIPKKFNDKIMAYNFDTSMWFKLDEPDDDQNNQYKYNGFLDEKKDSKDSYGRIFSCCLPRFSFMSIFNSNTRKKKI